MHEQYCTIGCGTQTQTQQWWYFGACQEATQQEETDSQETGTQEADSSLESRSPGTDSCGIQLYDRRWFGHGQVI
jgi:hypothetical protein